MLKTIFSHFYNEEYLLPWWLEHHKKIFDHGVLINYSSTDNSVDIIKKICPTWEIVSSRFTEFEAEKIEIEVIELEKKYPGWKMCLNTTEFLHGDMSYLDERSNSEYIVPCFIMVDNNVEVLPTYDRSLIEQKYYGIHFRSNIRRPRKIHNKSYEEYPVGRHYPFGSDNNNDLFVMWYGYSPFNDFQIKRKLQIQNKMSASDKARGYGVEHIVTKEKLVEQYRNSFLPRAEDLRKFINRNFI